MKNWEIFPNDPMNPHGFNEGSLNDAQGDRFGPRDGGDPLPPPGSQGQGRGYQGG